MLYLLKATEGNLILGGSGRGRGRPALASGHHELDAAGAPVLGDSTYLFAVYLVYALEWTFASDLGPAEHGSVACSSGPWRWSPR